MILGNGWQMPADIWNLDVLVRSVFCMVGVSTNGGLVVGYDRRQRVISAYP